MPEIRLVTAAGTAIKPVADHEDVARSAQRPCAGSCAYLDPPTNQCEGVVRVDGDARASVSFVGGERCTVTP